MSERTTRIASLAPVYGYIQIDTSSRAGLLPHLSAQVARLDLPPIDTYATMPASEWRDAADVVAPLLLEHCIPLLYLHAGRAGRCAHTRAVYCLLNTVTELDIVAGLTWLPVADHVLDDDPRKGA